ncbi:MAG: malto-oligosyltrehalose synthase [Acidobacteriota bacterium]
MRVPAATYRLQFNSSFRFQDARSLVPYLHGLGISDLYASPLFKARAQSTHGYDVIDFSRLNPQLGSERDFDALAQELRSRGMGLLLDIVPNHMALDTENPWWTDVLQYGPESRYASYFDIDWNPACNSFQNRVMLPVLGEPYGQALESGNLRVTSEEETHFLHYHRLRLPLAPSSHPFIEEGPMDLERLHQLLEMQPYRLAYWRKAREELNYRRFFNISDLIAVSVENPQAFEDVHALVFRLIEEGKITGLRIDHIDGLTDPAGYLMRLQESICTRLLELIGSPEPIGSPESIQAATVRERPLYVLVEKVLAGDEDLPADWPVCGTTGYDHLNLLNGIFVEPQGLAVLNSLYMRFTGLKTSRPDVVYHKKKEVIQKLFAGEIRTLGLHLKRLADHDRHGRDLPVKDLDRSLVEVTACLSVYRSYTRACEVSVRDRSRIERALGEARRRNPSIGVPVFTFLRRVLLLDTGAPEQRRDWLQFVMQWQKFASPVTAKGVEDTAFYVDNRLISINEVGADPEAGAISLEKFHDFNSHRLQYWPCTLNATSTHDTKRSEDVRARINVLSELPQAWEERLQRWSEWNRSGMQLVDGRPIPEPNEEILIYQSLVGAWPLAEAERPDFKDRLKEYLIKAAREAKVNTRWSRPHAAHERTLQGFVEFLFSASGPFMEDFLHFQQQIAFYGALNSLSQLLLKVCSPGVPDFYQGTELWSFSLVDPDNRRPVDFDTRRRLLARLKNDEGRDRPGLTSELLSSWQDGRIKLFFTYKALELRNARKRLFQEGSYEPLEVIGDRAYNVCAFMRRIDNECFLLAVPRFFTHLSRPGRFPLGLDTWADTRLILAPDAPRELRQALTGEAIPVVTENGGLVLPLANLFTTLPWALLISAQ